MAKRKRIRSPHPGVVLIPPDPEHGHPTWRARYVDPDTGRKVKVRLDPLAVPTAETRRDWAIRKAKALAKRRLELEGGAPRATGTALPAALDQYFKDHPHLRPRTRQIYKRVADGLAAWGAGVGVRSADDLTGPRLVAFRAELVKETRRVHVEGGKRGELQATDAPRSPNTINSDLRAIGTVLGYLRRLGLLTRLTADELRDGLKKLKAPPQRIDYRKPHELQRVLDAALRHDAATFTATRDEHAGRGEKGRTVRYTPIAPVIAAALITGMRFQALIDLDWKHVDLDTRDHEGRVVGEIVPPAGSTTKRAGVIGLEISPALRRMLAAMHLRSGGVGTVFGLSREEAKASLRRLAAEYGAPAGSTWQAFRRTCGCYLTNAPGIFGAASAYRSAKQLGHSVQVAERHYVDVVRGIQRDARTVEAAMQIESELSKIMTAVGVRPALAMAVT
ncbi:MAG: hypothetical protein ABUL60_24005 [Myxococcales bacterium]